MATTSLLSSIQQLPLGVVNKIAAGEVIERPASALKELLENSLDAGASRIDVALRGGGGDWLRVADDGAGIPVEELPLAVASHATSKIREADDLFRVATFGFRGEALASIAEVSRLVIRSRTAEGEAGAELTVHGGRVEGPAPCGCGVGTTIEVADLFYNTPVRRKFLRTIPTEAGHCSEAVQRLALAHPRVAFRLMHNERQVLELPPVESRAARIGAIFGRELEEALLPVAADDGEVRVEAWLAPPAHHRGSNRMQYFFLNGRYIRDRALQHALAEAYRGLLMVGRHAIGFVFLEMPAELVDVNVHPCKLEVRFLDSGRVYAQLLGAIRKKFLATDLTARFPSGPGERGSAERAAEADRAEGGGTAPAHDPEAARRAREELIRWAQSGRNAPPAAEEPGEAPEERLPAEFGEPLALQPIPAEFPREPAAGPSPPTHGAPPAVPQRPPTTPAGGGAIQVHNRYLVAESEDGMVVIDQHALHERILYEQIRERVLAGRVETQRLLVPEPVTLSPAECAAVLEQQELLAEMGILVEPFGGDTLLVTGYPAMLGNLGPSELLRQAAEQIVAGGRAPERRDLLDSLLHGFACKGAIKAGDHLSPEEIMALLALRDRYQDSHHCPHGRPTALVFTREELDRRFGRV